MQHKVFAYALTRTGEVNAIAKPVVIVPPRMLWPRAISTLQISSRSYPVILCIVDSASMDHVDIMKDNVASLICRDRPSSLVLL